jgi:hypothetical protein
MASLPVRPRSFGIPVPTIAAGWALIADIVAKVAEASLWNSNLKQSNRGVRTFES